MASSLAAPQGVIRHSPLLTDKHSSSSSSPSPKPLFLGLGRATLRGVRKCPKCGTYNGTRGLSCKNKECGAVFKDKPRKPSGHSAESVKIITGSSLSGLIYSVRLRDRGPDYRGFIQLPATTASLATEEDALFSTAQPAGVEARCYVESCHRQMVVGEPAAGTLGQRQACPHLRLAEDCLEEATPLNLKHSVLNALPISDQVNQQIWLLATETAGPLVQRVTKTVFVVKCKPEPGRRALGFLHVSFAEGTRKGGGQPAEHRFHCSCRDFKSFKAAAAAVAPAEEYRRRCVHFYACICAFGSDPKLSQEFAHFIHLDDFDQHHHQHQHQHQTDSELVAKEMQINLGAVFDETQQATAVISLSPPPTKKKRNHHNLGTPEPLVFHIPQRFFDVLEERISQGYRKKRLPNSTTAFIRRDAPPLGTFTKYTWHITNVLHVKHIFDTAEQTLDVTRSFVENYDGTFAQYSTPKVQVESIADAYKKTTHRHPSAIRPFELRTFLKVGNMSANQKTPTPFVIEWIPDVLVKSKIGELRIKFEYGHQRNGQVREHHHSAVATGAPKVRL